VGALLGLADAAAAQVTISDVSVSEATIGTEFVITGTGFGAKPKVAFSQGGEGVKKTKLKVLAGNDTGITVLVKKAFAGTFNLQVKPKGGDPVESKQTVQIVAPILWDPPEIAQPGRMVAPVAVGDADGDGVPDIAVGSNETGESSMTGAIHLIHGDGNLHDGGATHANWPISSTCGSATVARYFRSSSPTPPVSRSPTPTPAG